jgi:hypothetical protein
MFVALILAATLPADASAEELITIGEPGPEALKFRVWTNKEEGEAFRPGDRAIIFLSAERPAYVTVLSLSAQGNVTVVLPNKLMPNNMIEPHKLYALFGDDAPVRLTTEKSTSKGKLVLYLSSAPFVLDPLAIPKDRKWLTMGSDATKNVQILKEKLQAMTKDEAFNRATLSLPGATGDDLEIKMTEVPKQAAKKALPGGIESSVPETITGSAGLKPLRKGNLKQ